MSMIFFYFLKIIFDISTSKRFKTYKPYLILVKKKNSNFLETQPQPRSQTFPYSLDSNRLLDWDEKKIKKPENE